MTCPGCRTTMRLSPGLNPEYICGSCGKRRPAPREEKSSGHFEPYVNKVDLLETTSPQPTPDVPRGAPTPPKIVEKPRVVEKPAEPPPKTPVPKKKDKVITSVETKKRKRDMKKLAD